MVNKSRVNLFIILFIIISTFLTWNAGLTYSSGSPDAFLYIHGEKSNNGPLFDGTNLRGNGPWAPGTTDNGTLKIYNNYSERIKVNSLGLSMKLEKLNGEVYELITDAGIFEKFAKYMKLTVKKGKLLVFSDTIYNGSFYEMLYEKNSSVYKGYNLPSSYTFNIRQGSDLDLQYTVHMDEEAGNDMQGLRATVAFMVNVEENPEPYIPGNNPPTGNEPGNEDNYNIPDIQNHWSHDCIIALIKNGILEPYPDSTIRPENFITRAEVAVLMGKALKLEDLSAAESPYKDSLPVQARGYIISTTLKGVFKGYPDKTFKPESKITREEITAVLVRAFEKKLKDNIELDFKDKDMVAKWAMDDVRVAVQNNVIEGYPDHTFKPKGNITRAETFTILCKLLDYHKEHDKKTDR